MTQYLLLYPGSFPLTSVWEERAWVDWGAQTVDFQHLISGGSDQVVEQNRADVRPSKGMANKQQALNS